MTLQLPQLPKMYCCLCKWFHPTYVLKEFGVIGTPSKTYKLMSHYDKNILINSEL